jgi:hypothetical protein
MNPNLIRRSTAILLITSITMNPVSGFSFLVSRSPAISLTRNPKQETRNVLFVWQTVSPPAGEFRNEGGEFGTAPIKEAKREAHARPMPWLSLFGPSWLDRWTSYAALHVIIAAANAGNLSDVYSGPPGMFRFMRQLEYRVPAVGDIPLIYFYWTFGEPIAIWHWTQHLQRRPIRLGWRPPPATYNILRDAARLYEESSLKHEQGQDFLTDLQEKLHQTPEEALEIKKVLSGWSGLSIRRVLLGGQPAHRDLGRPDRIFQALSDNASLRSLSWSRVRQGLVNEFKEGHLLNMTEADIARTLLPETSRESIRQHLMAIESRLREVVKVLALPEYNPNDIRTHPIEVLHLSAQTEAKLKELGVVTIDDLLGDWSAAELRFSPQTIQAINKQLNLLQPRLTLPPNLKQRVLGNIQFALQQMFGDPLLDFLTEKRFKAWISTARKGSDPLTRRLYKDVDSVYWSAQTAILTRSAQLSTMAVIRIAMDIAGFISDAPPPLPSGRLMPGGFRVIRGKSA